MADPGHKTEITHDVYLQALGLFTLASLHAAKSRVFEEEMARLLGFDWDECAYASCVSDAIYTPDDSFDLALKRGGIAVLQAPAPIADERGGSASPPSRSTARR